jgi:hypothetical protein
MKRKSDSNTYKSISFSLSQPALSATPISSRNVLRNWQPPLKIVRHDCDAENTAQNSWLQEITPSTDNVCGDDSIGNEQLAMDNKGLDGGKVHAESKSTGCNGNGKEDKSLSQQSTQKYVPTENERNETQGAKSQQFTQKYVPIENERNETQGEKSKYEGSERDEVKNIEISCAVQKAGKKPERNSVHVTNSADITAENKDPDPSNFMSKVDGNKCNTPFTEHLGEELYQCLTPTKHTQNKKNQILTKEDEDQLQDMTDDVQEGCGKNIMNQSDNIILPPNKKFLTLMYNPSNSEEESKMKPGYDPILCQIQSLTVKLPQYMHSMRTLIGSEEDSPLPPDQVLKDLSHSQLIGDGTKEMELTKTKPESPATTNIKISEQKSGTNKCEGKEYMSDDILRAENERGKNNHFPLMAIEFKQIASSSGHEPEIECQELSLLSSDVPINKSEVLLEKMTETVTLSLSGAVEVPEICNVDSLKLPTHKEHEDLETVTPKVLSDTNLNNKPETPKLATNVCDVKYTMLKRNTEAANMKTAPQSLDAATAEDYSEKSKSPSEPLTAASISTEEHLIKIHEEALNTAPCSAVSTKNDKDKPGIAHNRIYDNCFQHLVTNAKVENTEPPNVEHPSIAMTKESLPKQEQINQSEGYLYTLKDIFCKSPTTTMEAPIILENAGENPLTNENRPNTASHSYMLDDDIGLTGSQLLRIEDECQYKVQNTEGVRNHTSIRGEAIAADAAASAPKLPPPNWAQIVQAKRQKLRSVIRDISRLK